MLQAIQSLKEGIEKEQYTVRMLQAPNRKIRGFCGEPGLIWCSWIQDASHPQLFTYLLCFFTESLGETKIGFGRILYGQPNTKEMVEDLILPGLNTEKKKTDDIWGLDKM